MLCDMMKHIYTLTSLSQGHVFLLLSESYILWIAREVETTLTRHRRLRPRGYLPEHPPNSNSRDNR